VKDQHATHEVGAFCWIVLAPDIVTPGREEQGSVSEQTSWGVLAPRELWGLTLRWVPFIGQPRPLTSLRKLWATSERRTLPGPICLG
jgi:hypothetical protein